MRRFIVRGLVVVAIALVGFAGWNAFRVWQAWRGIDRIPFDPAAVSAVLEQRSKGTPTRLGPGEPHADAAPHPAPVAPADVDIPDEAFDAYLAVGNDAEPERGSNRADTILLLLMPEEGDPALVSIPRDLWVESPCTGIPVRISVTLNGCEQIATGPELLAVTVQEFTGIEVDHMAIFDFEGFMEVIDTLGGIQICVDHALRNHGKPVLPEGCSLADGAAALAWIRSRTTEELVDGKWRPLVGDGDAMRNERQQEILLQMLRKLGGFRSPNRVAGLLEDVSDAFVLDEELSLNEAIGLAWDLRGLDPGRIRRPVLPVHAAVTGSGEFIVVPDEAFATLLQETYPGLVADASAPGP